MHESTAALTTWMFSGHCWPLRVCCPQQAEQQVAELAARQKDIQQQQDALQLQQKLAQDQAGELVRQAQDCCLSHLLGYSLVLRQKSSPPAFAGLTLSTSPALAQEGSRKRHCKSGTAGLYPMPQTSLCGRAAGTPRNFAALNSKLQWVIDTTHTVCGLPIEFPN